MSSSKRPRKEKTRDELLSEIEDLKFIVSKYCTSSTLEDADDADDTAEVQKNLMIFKKHTEDMKSMSEDLVCRQREAYDELTYAHKRMTQVAAKYSSGNQASISDEEFEQAVKLAEERQAEIEVLKREKKDLEAEFEQLKDIVHRSMGHGSTSSDQRRLESSANREGDCYEEFKKINDKLKESLQEKEDDLEYQTALSRTLTVKEHFLNNELHEARKELIRGLGDECNSSVLFGIKRMGELHPNTFDHLFPETGGKGGARRKDCHIVQSVQLCSYWEDRLRDPEWHPFKVIEVDGKSKLVVKEDDEEMNIIKDDYGEEVYKAIIGAAMELEDYNASGREPVQEIWNFKEKRRATTKEAISLVLKQLKACRSRGRR